MNANILIYLGFLFLIIILGIKYLNTSKNKNSNNSSQDGYQQYAKFYGTTTHYDKSFDQKVNQIINLVKYNKVTNIKDIAKEVNCTLEATILIISYLENIKVFDNIHIDKKNYQIIDCCAEDEKLIKKYTPYIYYNHFSIEEIATKVRMTNHYQLEDVINQVYDELTYLIDNDLVHGLKIDPVDRKIIYLSTGKDKTSHSKDLITINCPRCGALNDINRCVKTRCLYCNSILEDKKH